MSSYVTLADVKAMVLKMVAFEVRDAKTGEDLTRSILLQIILEEETGGVPIFSTSTLSQIIRFYGNAMQGMMGSYLEKNLQTFTDIQGRLADQTKGLVDPKLQTPEMWSQFLSGPGTGRPGPDGQLSRAVRGTCSCRCRSRWPSRPARSSRGCPASSRLSAEGRAGATSAKIAA